MLLFHDSFDHYAATADIWTNWDSISTNVNFSAAGGVLGGGAVNITADDRVMNKRFRLVDGPNERVLRFAAWFKAASPVADYIAYFRDESLGIFHNLLVTSAGTVLVGKSSDSTFGQDQTLASATNICDNNYHFLELYIFADATNGVIKLKIDGVTEINETNTDTSDNGSPIINRFSELELHMVNSGGYWDDVILWNDTVSGDDDFTGELGGIRYFKSLSVDGAGSSTQFTPTGAATNHEAVDEAGFHDGITSYVESDTVGHKDLYTVEDLAGVTDIECVAVQAVVQTEPGSTTQTKLKLKSGATEAEGPSELIASNNWVIRRTGFGTDPNTGVAWAMADVNNIEVGIEVV